MLHTSVRLAAVLALVAPTAASDNVLLLIADDLGVDRIAAYGEHPDPGLTPHLDQLAAEGMLFRNCWSNPYCSATRATIWTGRYCFRTGVGWYINPWADPFGLLGHERTLPRTIARGSDGAVVTALIGKWHVSGMNQGMIHPNVAGWTHYSGQPNNLVNGQDYYDWQEIDDGAARWIHRYATTESVDAALTTIARFGDRPWFVAIGFHAPHFPFHAPPEELHDYTLSGDPNDTPFEHGKAAIQAMDTEIGRLLASIDPDVLARTTVLFVGDNGTDKPLSVAPFLPEHGKPSMFEGGINVPLLAWGSAVTAKGTQCDALVNTSDLFTTVCDLLAVPTPPLGQDPLGPVDSVSLLPYLSAPDTPSLREFVYSEKFAPLHGQPPFKQQERAIRDARYKLKVNVKAQTEELYDLALDPFEVTDLLLGVLDDEQSAAYAQLKARLVALVGG